MLAFSLRIYYLLYLKDLICYSTVAVYNYLLLNQFHYAQVLTTWFCGYYCSDKNIHQMIRPNLRGSAAQWVKHLIHNRSVVSLSPIKGSCCFHEQNTWLALFSTTCSLSQKCIHGWLHNQTEINWGRYGRLTFM